MSLVNETGAPDPDRAIDMMFVVVEQIRLIDDEMAVAAIELANAHRCAKAESDEYLAETEQIAPGSGGDWQGAIDKMAVPTSELERLHRALTDAFRKATDQ